MTIHAELLEWPLTLKQKPGAYCLWSLETTITCFCSESEQNWLLQCWNPQVPYCRDHCLAAGLSPTTCNDQFVVHLLSHIQLFETPWTAAHQASLSFTVSPSLLKLMLSGWCHPTISSSVIPISSLHGAVLSDQNPCTPDASLAATRSKSKKTIMVSLFILPFHLLAVSPIGRAKSVAIWQGNLGLHRVSRLPTSCDSEQSKKKKKKPKQKKGGLENGYCTCYKWYKSLGTI